MWFFFHSIRFVRFCVCKMFNEFIGSLMDFVFTQFSRRWKGVVSRGMKAWVEQWISDQNRHKYIEMGWISTKKASKLVEYGSGYPYRQPKVSAANRSAYKAANFHHDLPFVGHDSVRTQVKAAEKKCSWERKLRAIRPNLMIAHWKQVNFWCIFFNRIFFFSVLSKFPITRNYSLALQNIPIESLSLRRESSEPSSFPAPWVQM